jgi:O-antigen/teichoic acid export membrane protein
MSREGHRARHHSRIAIAALAALTVPSVIGGYILAPWILGIFGHPYAVHSTTLLRMQLLALPASAVMVMYTAYAWFDQRVWRLVLRQLAMLAIFLITLSLLVDRVGILAVGWATIVSSTIVSSFVLPATIRRYRETQ